MLANSTLGGFPTNGARLGGATLAGIFDSIPAQSLTFSVADIKYYQQALNAIAAKKPSLLPPLAVDGKLGEKTYARISEFQRTNNLTVTGALDAATTHEITGQYFVVKNPIKPTPIYSSGERDNDMRKIMKITYDTIKDTCNCKLSLDGLKIIWPENPQGAGAAPGDSFADWLPGGSKANALIDDILGATKDVATAGAKGFGQGFGATLPYAPLVYVGGAVIGVIILKKFF
jgi:hypothetical protein